MIKQFPLGPAQPRGRRFVWIRAFPLAVVVTALAIAVAGAVMLVNGRGDAANGVHESAATAAIGGLTVATGVSGWAMADHVMPIPNSGSQPGYAMPPQMMPGMPTGDDARLTIPITLQNTSNEVRWFDLKTEFVLRGGLEADARTPHADTFGDLKRLGPGSAINGAIYFDAKAPAPTDPPLYLEWTRDGQTAQLTIRLDGTNPPEHPHQ